MRVSERGHQRAGLSNPALAASTPTTAALASTPNHPNIIATPDASLSASQNSSEVIAH